MRGCRPLEETEFLACLEALKEGPEPNRDRALLCLGVKAGFRISELLSVKISDVFQNGRFVDKVCVARRNMKKKKQSRTVALHSEARALIEVWVKELADRGIKEGFLFRSREGGDRAITRGRAHSIYTRAFEKCGLTGKLGTHCARKTFAKNIFEKLGHDLLRTQKALGHSEIKSTMSYLSFNEKDIDDAVLK